jgi:hypothetical protein
MNSDEGAAVRRKKEKLNLGKGAPFLKSSLKRLRQENATWQADFRALPQPMMQSETHCLGLVVERVGGTVLAETKIESTPDVNDLASLLANAMRRPLTGKAHRPRRILVRKNPRWRELFPHLEEIGVEVGLERDLSGVRAAYQEHVRREQEARRAGMVKPTAEQAEVEKLFPAVAQWVLDGHVEIGDQEGYGFGVRALDYGGLVFEDNRPRSLAEALAALDKGLRDWFEEQGVEIE